MTTDTMMILDTHPGEIIKDHMEELGWSQRDLAQRLGVLPKTVHQLIYHKTRIDRDYAEAFSRIFGHSVNFWLNLEKVWEDNERLKSAESEAKKHKAELTRFCYPELVKSGLIKDGCYFLEKVNTFLGFFRVANFDALSGIVESNSALYRRRCTKSATNETLAVWIMACERVSERVGADVEYSEKAFRSALDTIRRNMLMGSIDFAKLKEICSHAGVAVVSVSPFKGLGVYGASFWHNKKPVIALAWNYSDDRFWFYFFHEAAHILLEPQKEIFTEAKVGACVDEAEAKANAFSENMLLPDFDSDCFRNPSQDVIKKYASQMHVHPGIVLGRLKNKNLINNSAFQNLVLKTQPVYDMLV